MPAIVVLLPRDAVSTEELWRQLREWQKTQNLSWERLRLTPDFWQETGVDRELLQELVDLVRCGEVSRVVAYRVRPEQRQDPDWLAFALSLRGQGLALETIEDGTLALDSSLERLVQCFETLQDPNPPLLDDGSVTRKATSSVRKLGIATPKSYQLSKE